MNAPESGNAGFPNVDGSLAVPPIVTGVGRQDGRKPAEETGRLASDIQISDTQNSDVRTSDVQPSEVQPSEVQTLSALLELITRINQAAKLKVACEIAAAEIRQWMDADAVEIAWQQRPGMACKILATSGQTVGVLEGNTGTLQHHRIAAAEEVLTRDELTDSKARLGRQRMALLAVKEYAKLCGGDRILGASLGRHEAVGHASNVEDSVMTGGALLIRFSRMMSENEVSRALGQLNVIRAPITEALQRVSRDEPSWIIETYRSIRDKSSRARLTWSFMTICIVVGILAIPLPYRAPVTCELQPTRRQYIASPVAGPLKKTVVRPGDIVRSGQTLAWIDPREIEIELEGKRAELRREQQERKGLLAQHKTAEARLSELRGERIASEVSLLEHRLDKLTVTSPIDGTVVTGDWKQSEGTLVDKGETLFEIAPLGEFRIEVAVDESDVLYVGEKMQVRLRLESLPNDSFESTIDRIHPRAQLRDDENVFIAEAALFDRNGNLRPGMRGHGYVVTDSHPIGWNLFHKAYDRLIAWIGG